MFPCVSLLVNRYAGTTMNEELGLLPLRKVIENPNKLAHFLTESPRSRKNQVDRLFKRPNQVSAYGDITQHDLEDWYMRKGFTPVDFKKYGNTFLKWVPSG